MNGKITDFESMGSADGPGVRLVLFMAGCKLRCLYCHNPETWTDKGSREISPEEVLKKFKKYQNYYGEHGGVTFSGGEPLLQPEFLLETIKLLKQESIHVAIDTAGVASGYDEILDLVDLVILDVKQLMLTNINLSLAEILTSLKLFLKFASKKAKNYGLDRLLFQVSTMMKLMF